MTMFAFGRPSFGVGELIHGKRVRAPYLGRAFINQLKTVDADALLNIQSDSTGDALTNSITRKWPWFFAEAIEAAVPQKHIDFYYYNTVSKLYELKGLLGRVSTFATMVDTFARADGPVGTTGSGGQTWAANTYNVSGGKAVPTVANDELVPAASLTSDSWIVRADLGVPSSGTIRCYMQSDAARTGYLMLTIDANNCILWQSTASNPTQIFSALHGMTSGQVVPLSVTKDALNVFVEFGERQFFNTISSGLNSSLTGRTVRFMSVTAIGGHSYDNIYVGDATKPTRKLTIQCGAASGSNVTDHITDIASYVPAAPDLCIINLGHNNRMDSASTFLTKYHDLVTAIRTQSGQETPIVATIQNPETDPTYIAAHAANMAALKAATPANGWDCVDAYAPFINSPLWAGGSLMNDTVHPRVIGYRDVWADTAANRFGLV